MVKTYIINVADNWLSKPQNQPINHYKFCRISANPNQSLQEIIADLLKEKSLSNIYPYLERLKWQIHVKDLADWVTEYRDDYEEWFLDENENDELIFGGDTQSHMWIMLLTKELSLTINIDLKQEDEHPVEFQLYKAFITNKRPKWKLIKSRIAIHNNSQMRREIIRDWKPNGVTTQDMHHWIYDGTTNELQIDGIPYKKPFYKIIIKTYEDKLKELKAKHQIELNNLKKDFGLK